MADVHDHNKTAVKETLAERLSEQPQRMERVKLYKSFERMQGDGYVIAAASHDAGHSPAQALHGWQQALQAILAQLKMVQYAGEQMTLQLGDETVMMQSDKKDDATIYADLWLDALDLVLILRDHDALQYLLQFPDEKISPLQIPSEKYSYLLVQFWKALFARQPEAPKRLLEAYRATDPGTLQFTDPGKALLIDTPPLDVLSSFLAGDAAETNERIEEALQKHRQYCEEDDNRDYIPYLISVKLSAIAALLTDNDFPVSVQSGYMPAYCVQRSGNAAPVII
jgi:Immunity protein 49